jgi:hypothetical protein
MSSGIPSVWAKLGVKEGMSLAILNAPPGFTVDLPDGVVARQRLGKKADVVVLFTKRKSELERRIDTLAEVIRPAGSIWVAWPKRSSGVATDMTDHAVRDVALPLGLVDNKVCAIDETWTGLRLVWRLENRS